MRKLTLKKRYLLWIPVILMIAIIWLNSFATGTESGGLSKAITESLMRIVNHAGFSIPFDLFHHYVRKLAHFTEYFILALCTVTAQHNAPLSRHSLFINLTIGILTPSIDEMIQHFIPGRYGCVSDVCIDISGFLTGAFLLYLTLLIIQDLKRRLGK